MESWVNFGAEGSFSIACIVDTVVVGWVRLSYLVVHNWTPLMLVIISLETTWVEKLGELWSTCAEIRLPTWSAGTLPAIDTHAVHLGNRAGMIPYRLPPLRLYMA